MDFTRLAGSDGRREMDFTRFAGDCKGRGMDFAPPGEAGETLAGHFRQ